MRDKLKDREYFLALIKECNEIISITRENFRNNVVRPERVPSVKYGVYRSKKDIWLSRYSMDDPVADLVAPCREFIHDYLSIFNMDSYNEILWLLSVSVLMDIDDSTFNALANAIQTTDNGIQAAGTGTNDWMLNYLINYRIPSVEYKSSPSMLHKPYLNLRHVVEKSENKPADMYRYVTKIWYREHKDDYWYDNHKSKSNTYCGYWCVEAGAVAKILGLDDSKLKDSQYYPYDLVHWRDS